MVRTARRAAWRAPEPSPTWSTRRDRFLGGRAVTSTPVPGGSGLEANRGTVTTGKVVAIRCYRCGALPESQCPQCRRPFCRDHGNRLCLDCRRAGGALELRIPLRGVPSSVLYRSALVALVVVLALIAWDSWTWVAQGGPNQARLIPTACADRRPGDRPNRCPPAGRARPYRRRRRHAHLDRASVQCHHRRDRPVEQSRRPRVDPIGADAPHPSTVSVTDGTLETAPRRRQSVTRSPAFALQPRATLSLPCHHPRDDRVSCREPPAPIRARLNRPFIPPEQQASA
jgi:hypothetical protein